jgi:RNA-directed DNA polymerase
MHGHEKSDPAVVGVKSANKDGRPSAERMERRACPRESGGGEREPATHAPGTELGKRDPGAGSREPATGLDPVGTPQGSGRRNGSPHSCITSTSIRCMAFHALKRDAAPGVDGLTWTDYEADLEPRLADLHGRVHRGAYRPQPSRRTDIPKADGRQRPLAIAALEDKACPRTRSGDRPRRDCHGAERDLRGGLPRVLVWVPTRAWPA